jgi:hypothetical protein
MMSEIKYPLAFLTSAGCLFMKHSDKLSADGTPRYIPNPNSDATYCLEDCLKDYAPIWTKQELENILTTLSSRI